MEKAAHVIVHNWYRVGHSTRKKRRLIRKVNKTFSEPGLFQRIVYGKNNNWKQKQYSIRNAFEKTTLDYHIDIIYQGTWFFNVDGFRKEIVLKELKILFSIPKKLLKLLII